MFDLGRSLKSADELLNLIMLKFSPQNKLHIFQCLGKIVHAAFQGLQSKFHNNLSRLFDFHATSQIKNTYVIFAAAVVPDEFVRSKDQNISTAKTYSFLVHFINIVQHLTLAHQSKVAVQNLRSGAMMPNERQKLE